jgi:hypothetical protein
MRFASIFLTTKYKKYFGKIYSKQLQTHEVSLKNYFENLKFDFVRSSAHSKNHFQV